MAYLTQLLQGCLDKEQVVASLNDWVGMETLEGKLAGRQGGDQPHTPAPVQDQQASIPAQLCDTATLGPEL